MQHVATCVGSCVQFNIYQRLDSETDSSLHHDESIMNALILVRLVNWDQSTTLQ